MFKYACEGSTDKGVSVAPALCILKAKLQPYLVSKEHVPSTDLVSRHDYVRLVVCTGPVIHFNFTHCK